MARVLNCMRHRLTLFSALLVFILGLERLLPEPTESFLISWQCRRFIVAVILASEVLFALSLVEVLGELVDVGVAEFRTGLKIGRDSQNGKDFWRQLAAQFLAWHLRDPTKFYAYQGKVIR